MYQRHVTIIGLVVGLIVIFFGLMVLRVAFRSAGEGSCATGCCLWELGNSIVDLGCGLIGCGATLALLAVPLVAYVGRLHH